MVSVKGHAGYRSRPLGMKVEAGILTEVTFVDFGSELDIVRSHRNRVSRALF